MIYERIVPGKFIKRPNRFIAHVEINGKEEICHVKNTGRCREILVPGADVFMQVAENPDRKTKYDLISVYKGDMLINIDSQIPNAVFGEWVRNSDFFKNIELIKPESKYKNSRFDFYIEADNKKIFVEVKGVTLENDGVVSFPDAPTERGVKHLSELIDSVENGYEAYVFFIIQMENCKYFTPSYENHPEFAKMLKSAKNSGVKIKALNCIVDYNQIMANEFIKIKL